MQLSAEMLFPPMQHLIFCFGNDHVNNFDPTGLGGFGMEEVKKKKKKGKKLAEKGKKKKKGFFSRVFLSLIHI